MTKLTIRILIPLFCLLAAGCAHQKENRLTAEPPAVPAKDQPAPPQKIATTGKVLNGIAAIVNDEIITLYEINREAQPVIREREKKGTVDAEEERRIRRAALDGLVEKHLVEQKIRELNIRVSEEEIRQSIEDVKRQNGMTQEALVSALAGQGLSFDQYRSKLQEQLEKLKLVSAEVRSKIQVGETEMREYYEANRSSYTEEDTYRARHIFFKATDKASADVIKRSMTNALMVLAEAKSGKDFAQLAKTYSEDPAAAKDGGDLGRFRKNDMQPELAQAIVALKPGDVSELVYTPAGFHIIKLEERIGGRIKPFETVRGEIEETLYRKKSEERFAQWARELRAKATVEIKELNGLI